ncbi:opioid growth factor receptor-like protein 1 [Pseudorasbora parva]|uniref:opioid growth factor receptor-like protein 1 n=1 Tax=Pseudorasbora parva TaxID=51549 RepID=UPI00351DE2E3
MYFIQFLKSLICGVLRFVRRTLNLFWRVLGSYRGVRFIHQINMELDDKCDFDSTWEDGGENKQPRKKNYRMIDRNTYAAKDMQAFRHSVRNLDDDNDDELSEGRFYNLEFYHGRIKSSPDDVHIDEFHKEWRGDYRLLENCHSYIQWLFPIQERGVNWDAHVLTKKEIKAFRKDEAAKMKLVKSYKLMLDFYGIRLVNETTGEVKRANNWKERFSNLNRYTHNNLRITRILKCLGTLGLQHYQAPLVKFFLHETLVEGNLQNVKQSALDYFMFAVLDKSERRELVRFAFKNFKRREQFVWGPKKFLSREVDEDEQGPGESVEKNQKVIVGDAKKSDEVHSENKNFGQRTENRTADERETSERTVKTGSDKNNKDEQDPDESEKKIQTVSVGDAKKSDEVHSENKNFGQRTENRTADERETSERTVKTGSDKNNKDEQDPDESEKKNQTVSVGDAKKSGEIHSENENLNQLTENKDNSTHNGNQIDASIHVKGMLNEETGGKDQLVKTISNRSNEDEHDADENSQCSSNTKTAEKQDPETNSNEETSSHNNLK